MGSHRQMVSPPQGVLGETRACLLVVLRRGSCSGGQGASPSEHLPCSTHSWIPDYCMTLCRHVYLLLRSLENNCSCTFHCFVSNPFLNENAFGKAKAFEHSPLV